VHVSVHFRNNTSRSKTAIHNIGSLVRWPGHDCGIHTGHVLPVANHIQYHFCGKRCQFLHAVHGAGTIDVAQGQGPIHRGGQSGQVAGLEKYIACIGSCSRTGSCVHGSKYQRACLTGHTQTFLSIVVITVLVTVPAAQRVVTDDGHADVLRLPAGKWGVRATVILDRRC